MASFQLSPVKTALMREEKSDVAVAEGGRVREMSYRAIVRQTASLKTSVITTAVEAR